MRLIDADEFLENNKELADCDFIHPKYCDTLRDLVNNAPTVNVFEQIKEEIEQVEINGHIRDVECFRAGINTALNVIDKYR